MYELDNEILVEEQEKIIKEYVNELESRYQIIKDSFQIDEGSRWLLVALALFDVLEKIRGEQKDKHIGLNIYLWNNFEGFFRPLLYKKNWSIIELAYKLFHTEKYVRD